MSSVADRFSRLEPFHDTHVGIDRKDRNKIRSALDLYFVIARYTHVQKSRTAVVISKIHIVQDPVAVLDMACARIDIFSFQPFDRFVEQLDLPFCERDRIFIQIVADRKMAENAFDPDMIQMIHIFQFVKMLVVRLIDDPGTVHSGVELGMRPDRRIASCRILFKLMRVRIGNKRLDQTVAHQLAEMFRRRIPQDQDIVFDPVFAQFHRLVNA